MAHRILRELLDWGYVTRCRDGRPSFYAVPASLQMCHPHLARFRIAELRKGLGDNPGEPNSRAWR